MTKKRKQPGISETEQAELSMEPAKKEKLEDYRKRHDKRMRELEYEHVHGFFPPKPWYEE